jgi:dTDP-glucose pyrophosphorylase
MGTTLLILAAGMASRYGSLKQIEQVGPSGETILDYSIYDAMKAGFNKVVFVIRPDIEKEFNEVFISKLKKHIEVDYVFQDISMVPDGVEVPLNRVKPWGTSHAIMVAANKNNEPFASINADDYYGAAAYKEMYGFLSKLDVAETKYAMVGYSLVNTLSEFGTVSRGICEVDNNNFLQRVTERTKISTKGNKIVFIDEKDQSIDLDANSIVSMNFWGFTPAFFDQVKAQFKFFVSANIDNPKAEIYIPLVIDELIKSKQASVKVLHSADKWFGVTYKEDKPQVVAKINSLVDSGFILLGYGNRKSFLF